MGREMQGEIKSFFVIPVKNLVTSGFSVGAILFALPLSAANPARRDLVPCRGLLIDEGTRFQLFLPGAHFIDPDSLLVGSDDEFSQKLRPLSYERLADVSDRGAPIFARRFAPQVVDLDLDELAIDPEVAAIEDQRSRRAIGDVRLTNIAVHFGPESISDTEIWKYNWADSPGLIGQLSTGQFVMVYLFQKQDTRMPIGYRDTRFGLPEEQIEFLSRQVTASKLGVSGAVYGVQKFGESLLGLIVSLPPRGQHILYGGRRLFNAQTFKGLLNFIKTQIESGYEARSLNMDAYMAEEDGRFHFVPSSHQRLDVDIFKSPWIKILTDMGVSKLTPQQENDLQSEIRRDGLEEKTLDFLTILMENGVNDEVLKGLFNLLRPEALSRELALLATGLEKTLPTVKVEDQEKYASELVKVRHLISLLPDRNFYGPLVPHIQNQQFRSMRHLAIGNLIAIRIVPDRKHSRVTTQIESEAWLLGKVTSLSPETGAGIQIFWENGERVDYTLSFATKDLQSVGASLGIFSFSWEDTGRVIAGIEHVRNEEARARLLGVLVPAALDMPTVTAAINETKRRGVRTTVDQLERGPDKLHAPSSMRAFEVAHQLNVNLGENESVHLNSAETSLIVAKAGGKALVVIDFQGDMVIRRREIELKDKGEDVLHVGLRHLITFFNKNHYRVYDLTTGDELHTARADGLIGVVARPDDSLIGIVSLGYIIFYRPGEVPSSGTWRITDVDPFDRVVIFAKRRRTPPSTIRHALLSEDAQRLFLAYSGGGGDALIQVYDFSRETLLGVVESDLPEISEMHLSPDGKHLVLKGEAKKGEDDVFQVLKIQHQ